MKKRLKRILAWGLFSLVAMMGTGVLLADRLMPPADGAPGTDRLSPHTHPEHLPWTS